MCCRCGFRIRLSLVCPGIFFGGFETMLTFTELGNNNKIHNFHIEMCGSPGSFSLTICVTEVGDFLGFLLSAQI